MKLVIVILVLLLSIVNCQLFNVQGTIFDRVTVVADDGINLKTVFVPVNQGVDKTITSSTPIIVVPGPS
jgi:hypothetical protein